MMKSIWWQVVALFLWFGAAGPAAALEAVAERCEAALASGDPTDFEAVVDAIRLRKDVFDIDARKRVEACLSEGFGEPWEYSFPESEWLSVAEAKARAADREAAKAAAAQALADADAAAAQAAADRQVNAERVATLVYLSCTDLLARDQVAAMTNPVCVDSFLANGLPPE